MRQHPRVSVVMPVYNADQYLVAAVESILCQDYPNFELILVDDHSTDDAIQSLPVSIKSDPRLQIVASPARGVVAAMNFGVTLAMGDFIARMDADDLAMQDRFSRQVHYLQENDDIDIAGGQVEIFNQQGTGRGFQLYQGWINSLCAPDDIKRELFIESPIPNPTAIFRRQAYEALGGYHDSPWAEDYDMWLRADAAGMKMGKAEGIVLHWRDHESRLTRCDSRYDNDLFMQAKGHYLAKSCLSDRTATIWGTGPTGTRFHDILVEHDVNIDAFIEVHPRRIGGKKRGLPVFPIEVVSGMTDSLIIGAVGARGARQDIRQALVTMGKREGRDFLFVA